MSSSVMRTIKPSAFSKLLSSRSSTLSYNSNALRWNSQAKFLSLGATNVNRRNGFSGRQRNCLCVHCMSSKRFIHSSPVTCKGSSANAEMAEFLTGEIEHEQGNESPFSNAKELHGFKVETSDCDVVLSKKMNNETIRITFNVNDSIEDNYDDQAHSPEEDEPKLFSKPPFCVEITMGPKSMHINCAFPSIYQEGNDENEADLIEINNVYITAAGEEVKDAHFGLQGHDMDPNLYDMFLGMLEDRGINSKFVKDFVEFSTAHEKDMYIKFLKTLQGMVQ